MNVQQLGDNHMLVHLSLARCGVRAMTNFTFHNLHSLDLSGNLLTDVSLHHFDHMSELTVLFLAANPLTSVFEFFSSSSSDLRKMSILDLSQTHIHSIHSSLFIVFPSLQTLNLSHSHVKMLLWNHSQMAVASLRALDLRGCSIADFPSGILKGVISLQLLYADNFKVCCSSVLRPGFDLNRCHTAPDDVSSCDNLLGSVTFRATVAVLATLSLLGNVVSLTVRVCVGRMWRQSSGGVVLTHLSVADLGTGLYLATLGLADHLLAGQYVWQDNAWRRGVVCHFTGVLAKSCRHAATFFISILSFNHSLHRFPTLATCLTPTKMKITCGAVWTISLFLTVVPLTLQLRLFGQQVLCAPLPHKINDSIEFKYLYGVIVIAHFTMFVLSSSSQVVSILRNSNIMNRNQRPNDFRFVVLGSLASGFLYTVACLVPTDSYSDRQKAAHTAVVCFGSVVSSAINPYLYLYGVRVERSKRIKEERLLKIINRARV